MYSSRHMMQVPKLTIVTRHRNIEIYHICLLPAESIEDRNDWKGIVRIVKESASRERTGNGRLPPEHTLPPAVGSFHDHPVHLIKKLTLAFR